MDSIRCIGVLAHPLRPKTFPVAETIVNTLRQRDIKTWWHTRWDSGQVSDDVQCADMVVAIGGDGAMLKAARECAPYNVPVLGVNMGHLGFLTEVTRPENWSRHLERILKGDYWIETRMMVTASVLREGMSLMSGEALNDVVISGDVIGRMIKLDLYIDKHWATTYNADALIIATATGSTAYALAVGGPILPPDLLNILIVPSAPHLSMERPIVLSEGSIVDVLPSSGTRGQVLLSVDGMILGELQAGDRVQIQASQYSSRFVRMRERNYFYRSLLDRLEPRINARETPKKLLED